MWADHHIDRLRRGETVSFRPKGNSMKPRIKSGQLCTCEPVGSLKLEAGDVVLCNVGGKQYLHLIKKTDIDQDGRDRYQIGNNRGGINGWIGRHPIYGRLLSVKD